MKRALAGALFFAWAIVAACQTNENPIRVTMCDLYKNPNAYAGRMVEFRAFAMGRKIKNLWLDDFAPPQGCDAYMTVVAVVPKDIIPKPSFELREDALWQKFLSSIGSMRVEATFVGLFQPYFVWRDQRRIQVSEAVPSESRKQKGFDGRIVLLSVADVAARYTPRR